MADTLILSLSATTAAMVGLITKTDVVRQMGRCDGSGCTAAVATVMTRDVTHCHPGDLLHDVWSIMKERGLLHVPVVGKDFKPLGVINARDALLALLADPMWRWTAASALAE
jgi:CBS domain-containing protein